LEIIQDEKNNNGKFSDITQTRKKNSGKNQKKNAHQFHEIFAWFVRFKIYKLKFFFETKVFAALTGSEKKNWISPIALFYPR